MSLEKFPERIDTPPDVAAGNGTRKWFPYWLDYDEETGNGYGLSGMVPHLQLVGCHYRCKRY